MLSVPKRNVVIGLVLIALIGILKASKLLIVAYYISKLF